MINRRSLLLVLSLVWSTPSLGDDWPQWRGPNRDGVWREDGIIERFESQQIQAKWRVPIGSGYSGPTVANDRVFVTDRVRTPKPLGRVFCVDAQTGNELWRHEYACEYAVLYSAGPRAAVLVDGDFAFAIGAMGHTHCLEVATGKVVWRRDLRREYKVQLPAEDYGSASSPLEYDDLLIIHLGGSDGASILALDKSNGQERWRASKEHASYASPIITRQAGRDVLVVWSVDAVVGLDPQSGQVHWRHSFTPPRRPPICSTPIVQDDLLFLTSFFDGSLMLRLRSDELAVEKVWQRGGQNETRTEALHSIISTPLFQGDYIYGVDSYGELRCLEAATGDRLWEDQTVLPRSRFGTIHFVKQADNVWMFTERGTLIISKLSPKGLQEISRTHLIDPTREQFRKRDGVCWAHPAFANRHVYIRNDKELVCASLAAE